MARRWSLQMNANAQQKTSRERSSADAWQQSSEKQSRLEGHWTGTRLYKAQELKTSLCRFRSRTRLASAVASRRASLLASCSTLVSPTSRPLPHIANYARASLAGLTFSRRSQTIGIWFPFLWRKGEHSKNWKKGHGKDTSGGLFGLVVKKCTSEASTGNEKTHSDEQIESNIT